MYKYRLIDLIMGLDNLYPNLIILILKRKYPLYLDRYE